MAGTFTLLTCLITMFHMMQHLSNWYEPMIQRKIITILWMSPIYSITSWSSLIFGTAADGYLSIINNVYKAYAIYTFLSFLVAVLGKGNWNVAIQVLAQHANHMKQPTRCFTSCYHPPPDVSPEAKAGAVLLECQIWAMQFVLIRPFTSILRFVAKTIMSNKDQQDNDNNNNWDYFESPMLVIDMVTNASVFLAFHGLLKFYHTVHHDLQWCQPFSKLVSIKSIVFFNVLAVMIQSFLICLEMFFFSIAHWCVFPAEEWQPEYRPKKFAKRGIGLKDFASDISYTVSRSTSAHAYHKQRRRLHRELPVQSSNSLHISAAVNDMSLLIFISNGPLYLYENLRSVVLI
jgi:Organic solute transporter Ostalpha